jgi:hypothetical protein
MAETSRLIEAMLYRGNHHGQGFAVSATNTFTRNAADHAWCENSADIVTKGFAI